MGEFQGLCVKNGRIPGINVWTPQEVSQAYWVETWLSLYVHADAWETDSVRTLAGIVVTTKVAHIFIQVPLISKLDDNFYGYQWFGDVFTDHTSFEMINH